MSKIRRRQFLIAAGALLAARNTRAQTPKHARVGVLGSGSEPLSIWPALLPSELKKRGWVEGRNLTLDWRFADGRTDRLPELASELLQVGVQVIVAVSNTDAEAARRVTRSIPIVVLVALDPVGVGFAQSLARPGNNVTGVLWADPALGAKNMQIFKETLPGMRRLGLLYSPHVVGVGPFIEAYEVAARELGVRVYGLQVTHAEDVDAGLALVRKEKVDALYVVVGGGVVDIAIPQILNFVALNKIPSFHVVAWPVERGGLMSYSPKLSENASIGASMIDKLLKGAKPAELPFEYSTRFELVINRKTAKALGITIPQSVLLRADRVIE